MRIFLLGLFLILTASGCAQPVVQESAPSETPTAQTQAPTEGPTESPEPMPQPCSESTQNQMEQTINSQLAAFGDQDFELAYSFASPNFQAAVGVGEFVFIIESSYGPLIGTSSLSFSDCLSDSAEQLGLIEARFLQESNDVLALRYLMVNTDQGWKVEGATRLANIGEGA